MLLLTNTSSKLQVITSAASGIDVHASFMDYDAVNVTPTMKNTNIPTATTTDVTGSPGASIQRNVKTLHIRNKHASLACDITIQHTDGSIVVDLFKATLNAGASMQYTNDFGFVQL